VAIVTSPSFENRNRRLLTVTTYCTKGTYYLLLTRVRKVNTVMGRRGHVTVNYIVIKVKVLVN
jgi:hypothetical protein